jgi:hypothetical protein
MTITPQPRKRHRQHRSCKVHQADVLNNKATFQCSNCHYEWTGLIIHKPKALRGQPWQPSQAAVRMMARYWRDRVSTYCPRCS